MVFRTPLKLGELLIKEGLLTKEQMQDAFKVQKSTGKRLGETLLSMGIVTETQIAEALGKQLGLPYKRFDKKELIPDPDPALKKILSTDVVRKNQVLPLQKQGNRLVVALTDPLDILLMDNLKKMTGCVIQPVITTSTEIKAAIEQAYGKLDLLKKVVEGTYQADTQETESASAQLSFGDMEAQDIGSGETDDLEKAGEAQVIRLVDLFLLEAVKSRASDVHIEPYVNKISVRFRIDGVLKHVDPPAPHLMPALVSRIKILAKMDISEKRLPQDGGFTVKIADKTVDLRVSTVPVIYGEKVVIRILDKSNMKSDFDTLGFGADAKAKVEKAIHSPYGLIFITGPTGSGKSTTLYSALNQLISPRKNIMTIEDPCEYKIAGINQVQAKPKIGLTFASGLRAFLRQDPDIIMVGEVRDLETAEICVQAALTGHLVLSTLHTNDAPSAITRLTDLGIAPFLLSPSLILVVAQRLVRKLCDSCKKPTVPDAAIQEKLQLPPGEYKEAVGCDHCQGIGYRGRTGLYEVMVVTPKIRRLITDKADSSTIKNALKEEGFMSLFELGIDKAAAGETSIEEVLTLTTGDI